MLEWNIQARAHACQGCGRAFKNREPLHTLLFDERQAYHRLDVCEACWQAEHAQGSNHRRGFISHWESLYEPPPAAPPEPIQKETAESLLRKLVALNAPEHAGSVFILAVMLERKRILKVKAQTSEAGRRLLIYEHARNGDVFTIQDPELRLDQLDTVQREVAQLLEHGLPAAPAAPAAVEGAATATPEVPAQSPEDVAAPPVRNSASGPDRPPDTAPAS
jgi:hypothetical protein